MKGKRIIVLAAGSHDLNSLLIGSPPVHAPAQVWVIIMGNYRAN